MAYPLVKQTFNYWSTLLAQMQGAHTSSGVALADDLKTALDDASTQFKTLLDEFVRLRAHKKQVTKELREATENSIQVLRKAKYGLIYKASADKRGYALNRYKLDQATPRKRSEVLAGLRTIATTVETSGEDADLLSAALQTEAKDIYAVLSVKFTEDKTLRADIEENKRKLQEAIVTNTELRERIYAYLITVLEGGSQDPKLIDYGLRANFRMRRRTVTEVVDEQPATPEPAEPQPAQP